MSAAFLRTTPIRCGHLDELDLVAGEHAPVFLEVRPVGVGPPHDHAAPFGEGIGDGSEVERTAGEIPRSDREVLVVEEQCDAFVVAGHRSSLDVLVLWPVNDNVYIHEFIDIIGHNRANYMHHMTANFSPMAQEDRNQLCFGVWGVVGTTRGWPEVLNLWEERGFDGLATSFRFELGHSTLQDPKLAKWWAEASNYRRHGDDRVLVPAPWSPTITELLDAGVKGETYAHEQIHVPMGTARDFLEIVAEEAVPVYEEFGWKLCGAWETAMVNESECFLHWAIPTWESWAETETRGAEGQRAATLAQAHLRAQREVAPLPRRRRAALADAHRPSARARRPRRGLAGPVAINRSLARASTEHDVAMVERVVLAGDVVTLRPMTIDDVDALVAAASEDRTHVRLHAGARR